MKEGDQIMDDVQYYKISDFAKKIGFSSMTIYKWFDALEEKGIHYTQRIKGQKIYSDLDLEIANFIIESRKNSMPLEAIYDVIGMRLNVRSFPDDFQDKNELVSIPQMKEEVTNILKTVFKEEFEHMSAAIAKQLHDKTQLEAAKGSEIDQVTLRKIESNLRIQALKEWSKKSEDDRYIKSGWFRREEDLTKREIFVEEYIQEHYDKAIRDQIGKEG